MIVRLSLIALAVLVGCSKSAPPKDPPPAPVPAATAPPPIPKATTDTDAAKLGTLAPGTGIAVGEHAPDATALDLDGKPVKLSDLVAKGPLLVAFYRGGWCPYCNYEIHELTLAFPELQKRGVLPVAISVDIPEEGAKTSAKYTIPFPVISDSKLAIIGAFHVAITVDAAMLERMKSHGVVLESYSGETHHQIAIPALFLIDRDGIVRWAHDDPTFTVRPSTAQILAAIDATQLGGQP